MPCLVIQQIIEYILRLYFSDNNHNIARTIILFVTPLFYQIFFDFW